MDATLTEKNSSEPIFYKSSQLAWHFQKSTYVRSFLKEAQEALPHEFSKKVLSFNLSTEANFHDAKDFPSFFDKHLFYVALERKGARSPLAVAFSFFFSLSLPSSSLWVWIQSYVIISSPLMLTVTIFIAYFLQITPSNK